MTYKFIFHLFLACQGCKGEISYSSLRNGTDYLQRSLLEQEGILFNQKGKVNLSQYQWKPDV